MIHPIIMAAGEGRRMALQETSKVMLSVDGRYPLVGNAALRFLHAGFKAEEITITVGAHKEQIKEYLGDSFAYYDQIVIGDPTDGLIDWITERGLDTGDERQLVAVMNADDSCWNNEEDVRSLLTTCSNNGCEGILLTKSYEPGQHKIGFIPGGTSTVRATTTSYTNDAGYVAGFFVIHPTHFSHFISENRTEKKNIVNYLAYRHSIGETVVTAVDNQPRVAVNTRDALFYARHIQQRKTGN